MNLWSFTWHMTHDSHIAFNCAKFVFSFFQHFAICITINAYISLAIMLNGQQSNYLVLCFIVQAERKICKLKIFRTLSIDSRIIIIWYIFLLSFDPKWNSRARSMFDSSFLNLCLNRKRKLFSMNSYSTEFYQFYAHPLMKIPFPLTFMLPDIETDPPEKLFSDCW